MFCEGHKEPLMVKFADGGSKKRLQYNSLPWLSASDTDVRMSASAFLFAKNNFDSISFDSREKIDLN